MDPAIERSFDVTALDMNGETSTVGHRPTRFHEAVSQQDCLETAHPLLANRVAQRGLMELWLPGRRDLSMERLFTTGNRASLFSHEEHWTAPGCLQMIAEWAKHYVER